MRAMKVIGALVLVALAVTLCTQCGGDPYPYLSPAGKRGYAVYRAECKLCHTGPFDNPTTGPPIAGASREVIQAKVIGRDGRGFYPDGHQPKRPGEITMKVLPHLTKEQLDDVAAFLREVKPD